ncbi:MAG: NAD(P)/FAD-dependent oxidoreductase [Campylobacter sp.]|nr:NAD(P)/FAD-dependent oxidoreductase [Campylobacter sp.]
MKDADVLIVGAGPSGSICSAILNKNGFNVYCVEKEYFPRFVIGESLLPNCMNYLEEAGFLDAVKRYGFQYKNGAAFSYKDEYRYFDFCDKTTPGYGTTYQVVRGEFDKILIDEAVKQGVEVDFGVEALNMEFKDNCVLTTLSNDQTVRSKFIVDASGYSRVLPTLLNLEVKSHLSPKKAYFTHIEDKISEPLYDRNKILITTHPEHRNVWFWLIPFSNGRCSIGVVGEDEFIKINGLNELDTLKHHVYKAPMLSRLLKNSVWDTPAKYIQGYSKNVSKLYGDRFIMLGNSTEFLDPVFSSGVTIAMHSASLAAKCLSKILKDEHCDLEKEYKEPLMLGVNAFRTYVDGWYDCSFQDVIYNGKNHDIKRNISSILAGYAWDENNVYVKRSNEALRALWEYCK